MKVAHVSEDMAIRTANALLKYEGAKPREQLSVLALGWVNVLEQEFEGYVYMDALGIVMKVVGEQT